MPRDGTKNLRSISDRPIEEQQEIRSKGGKASGEARRKKRLLRDTLEDLLSITSSKGKTYQDDISFALLQAALKGDVKAFEVIRDTIGQKPIDRMQAEVELPTFKNDLDE